MTSCHQHVSTCYGQILKGRGYGKECDIWSLGVVFFIALGGYPPFDGVNEDMVRLVHLG